MRDKLIPVSLLAALEAGCVWLILGNLDFLREIVPWLAWGVGVALTALLYPVAQRIGGVPVLLRPVLFVGLGGAGLAATGLATVLLLAWTGVVLELPAPSGSVIDGALDLTFSAPLIGVAVAWEYWWVSVVISIAAWGLIEVERARGMAPRAHHP